MALRVDKSDVAILMYLWESEEGQRNPFIISEELNLSYNYVCHKLGTLKQRGAIKQSYLEKKSYYTKPLKGYMYEALRQLTGLTMKECVERFDEIMGGEDG